jgi:3-hydroxyanthranilate 3,4-dioxygenase
VQPARVPHSEFIIMVVGGRTRAATTMKIRARNFSISSKATMTLRTMQDRGRVDIPIHAGEVLLLPPRVPHSPQRSANTSAW